MGYAFLVRDADPQARELLDDVFSAETVEAMQEGFASLTAEMEWRREEHERAEAEAMRQARKSGARDRPRPTKRVNEDALQAAIDAWADTGTAVTYELWTGDQDEEPV